MGNELLGVREGMLLRDNVIAQRSSKSQELGLVNFLFCILFTFDAPN